MTTIRAAPVARAVSHGPSPVRAPETRAALAPRPSRARTVAKLGGGCVAQPRGASLTASATRVARRKYPEREPDDDDDDDGSAESPSASSEAAEDSPTKPGFDADGKKLKWMEILEESAEYDPEIKNLLDGADSNPDEVEKRIRERFEQRKERIYQEREGSTVPMLVKFREFNSQNLWIHLESHNNVSDMEQPLLDEVFKAWFVLGKLGGFNSDNMQVQANFFEVSNFYVVAKRNVLFDNTDFNNSRLTPEKLQNSQPNISLEPHNIDNQLILEKFYINNGDDLASKTLGYLNVQGVPGDIQQYCIS